MPSDYQLAAIRARWVGSELARPDRISKSLEGRCTPFGQNASASIPSGTSSLEYAPLIATRRMDGNRRRTIARSSRPPIPGIVGSESRTSGVKSVSSASAENPEPSSTTSIVPLFAIRHSSSMIECALAHKSPTAARSIERASGAGLSSLGS
jgi:hypothetical protein